MKTYKYIIIGNSAAAIGAIQGIRQIDQENEILILTSEVWDTYSRPLISYWLQGKVEREKMRYRGAHFYEQNKCQVRYGAEVSAIDGKEKTVVLSDGEKISYNKLLVATGSKPFVPPLKGLFDLDQSENIFTFASLEDAIGIRKVLEKESKVVILGAGLIGLKAAEAVIDQCQKVTVVDLANRVLPSVLDEKSAEKVQGHLNEQGIDFRLENGIEEIKEKYLRLSSGEVVDYDLLIVAVGTRPRTDLIEAAGGEIGRGIVTNDHQLTTLADIYAAGDCTETYDISSETDKNMAILPNAFLQGEVAGINMAGGTRIYEKAFPVNALGLMGLYILTAGTYTGEIHELKTAKNDQKMFVEANQLKGYIIIGDCLRAGIYTDLIRSGRDLSTVDWDLLLKDPQIMAFKPEFRKETLARPH